MNKNLIVITAIGLICSSLLVACGGGSGGTSGGGTTGGGTTLTGIFNDSPVDGLAYSCVPSGQSGTTQNGGQFTYVAGDTCSFFLGAVELGTATAHEIVTPVELVVSGTPSDPTVVNIVQLLTTADEDGDPSNGINIPAEVADAAQAWTGVNVTSGTFDSDPDVIRMVEDIDAIFMRTVWLTSEGEAQNHMMATAKCVYSGLFSGSWQDSTGGIQGEWGVILFPDLTAQGISDDTSGGAGSFQGSFDNATNMITLDGNHAGMVATVTGTISGTSSVSGTINSGGAEVGSFSGSRFAGSPTATYRYTGFFSGGAEGVLSIDIDSARSVSGKGYSFSDKSTFTLSGSVDVNGALTLSASNGVTGRADLDLANGTIANATWGDGTYSGAFAGSGCKLN